MCIVEIRRHTERDADENLTAKGVEIAAEARKTLEFPYDAYFVGPKKRARLTMEAFGIRDAIGLEGLGPRPRAEFAAFEPRHDALLREGVDAVTAWFAIPECVPLLLADGQIGLGAVLDVAAKLPEGGRALAVSHGGTIEPLAVAAARRPYAQLFGTAELGYCEGVRARVRSGRAVRIDVVRFPA